jgi:signal transduction histidine kinase
VDQPITQVLRGAADAMASLLPADRVSIIGFSVDKEVVDYFIEGGKGRGQVVTTVTYDELWDGLSGWVLKGGAPALSSKLVPDPRESESVRARRRETNCGSILVVPVRNNERLLGTITAINLPDERDFDEDDVEKMMVLALSAGVLIENAKLLADVKLSRDVAEASRVQLSEQNVMKDKLFTILAHDLRGPVGNLSVLLGVVAETPMSGEDFHDILLESQRSATQTYNLLDNLLGWVRAQMDEVKVLHTRFRLYESLVSVQLWMEPQASVKNIAIRLECPPEMTVAGDQRMSETIVRNLVSNAVKYSREGSEVVIRVLNRDESVLVEVIDQGQGLPPEKLKELFGRRQVASSVGTGGERGSGLGLMFCADLARAQGGYLEAESVVSVGSTFRLVLPDPVEGEL